MCCEEDECDGCWEWMAGCLLVQKIIGKLCPKCAREYEDKLLAFSRMSFGPRGTTFGSLLPLYKNETEETMQPAMIAEIAYNAYAKVTNNKNVRGEELPLFSELGEQIQNAWIAAVSAVRMPRLADLADRPLVDAFQRLQLAAGDPDLLPGEGETVEIVLIDHVIDKLAGENGVAAA